MQNSMNAKMPQRLCGSHGYRFDGDYVHLNADVMFSEMDVERQGVWSLQLWANRAGFPEGKLVGVKVADLALQPQAGWVSAAGCSLALPPAGADPQILGMALVTSEADGTIQVQDLAVFSGAETFLQPRIQGEPACRWTGDDIQIHIDAIANPRPLGTCSGSLVLELWALDAPYLGGGWQGKLLASAALASLSGGEACAGVDVQWAAAKSDAPLTLMLREWSPAGFVTRDFRNLAMTVSTGSAPDQVVTASLQTPVPMRRKPTPELKKQIPAKKKSKKSGHKVAASKRH